MDSKINENQKEDWLKLKRSCWKMVKMNDAKDKSPFEASKKGGTRPYLSLFNKWPRCSCKKDMTFFAQINLSKLPRKIKKATRNDSGILQLFICTNNNCHPAGPSAFSRRNCVRIVYPKGKSLTHTTTSKILKSIKITSYTEKVDYPLISEDCVNYDHSENKDMNWMGEHSSNAGDKLSGWPMWIKSPKYPNCPKCRKQMIFIWQQELISMTDYMNSGHMFRGKRRGYIMQCPTHKKVLAIVKQ